MIKKIIKNRIYLIIIFLLFGGHRVFAGYGTVVGVGVAQMAAGSIEDKKTGAGINAGIGGFAAIKAHATRAESATSAMWTLQSLGAFQQAGELLKSSKEDESTLDDLTVNQNPDCVGDDCFYEPSGTNLGSNSGDGTGPSSREDKELEDTITSALKDFASQGYTIDADGTVGLPNGNKISPSDMGDIGKVAEAVGLSEDEAQNILDQFVTAGNKIAKDHLKVSSVPLNTGGGGYSGSGSSGSGSSSYDPFKNLFGNKNKKRNPASAVKGMTKMTTGGDPIGVKEDNIFEIHHEAYRYLKKEGFALSPDYKPARPLK